MTDAPATADRPDALAPLVLTREQTAQLLQVSPDSVSNLHRIGALKAVKIGRSLRWRPADVRAYVEGLSGEGER